MKKNLPFLHKVKTLFLASFTAYSIALIMLSGDATPFPAISKAVPWSTDVRMMGNPSVMFTPLTESHRFFALSHLKPTIFKGM